KNGRFRSLDSSTMWMTSSLPLLPNQQHHPLQLPYSVSHAFSFPSPSTTSGFAARQNPSLRPHGPRLQLENFYQHSSDSISSLHHMARCYENSDGSCYSTSSGRRMLLFMSSTSFLFPPHALPETLHAAKLSTIQNSLRAVLSKAKAAGVLRMAFHDAGTYDTKDHSGGMNGSILYELDRPENVGLSKSLKILEKAKTEVDEIYQASWADFIAVAGAEAVFLCGGPAIPVKVGRLDVRKPDPVGKLPQETLDAVGLKSCFQRKGFSTQELVALSGAHTLGSKGFGNPNVFDNAYYKILLEKPWSASGSMSSMIGLPSDRALAEDDECLRWIKVYAGDQVKFFDDFSSAYVKLVDLGAVWRNDKV
ncbi:hypothetical protein M5K25_024186, partial [Dendrobium thyrsiflorum]